jgi:general stress protein 26
MTRDSAEIDGLWRPASSAFFDGKDDAHVAALHFDVTEGQYWDSPNGLLER